eukprot:maker-scaffold334_size202906-snap-gene-0.12 protein:Tk08955 transcript:maker-scaffold334_size202906-snap-gene-0.12-mRNA-1 annotation:"---NA---"
MPPLDTFFVLCDLQAEKAHLANDSDAINRLTRANPIVDFWAHTSSECAICDDPSYDRDVAEDQLKTVSLKRIHQPGSTAMVGTATGGAGPSTGAPAAVNGAAAKGPKPAQSGVFGKNRKYKANVLANILRILQTDAPAVLKSLRNFGIQYEQPTNVKLPSAFVVADTNRILKILENQPEKKKISTLVKAITDDIVDGKLSFFKDVGIKIDLLHPNLSFLLKKIRNFNPPTKTPAVAAPAATPGPSGVRTSNKPGPASRKFVAIRPRLPNSPVTPAPVAAKAASAKTPSAKTPTARTVKPVVPVMERHRTSSGIVRVPKAMVKIRPVDAPGEVLRSPSGVHVAARKRRAIEVDNANILKLQSGLGLNAVANLRMPNLQPKPKLSPDKLEDVKRQFLSFLPLTRPLKMDLIRYILIQEPERRLLLQKVGIQFESHQGNYLCPDALCAQTVFKCFTKLKPLADVQWAVIMAETVFKLINLDDLHSFYYIGLDIEEDHSKVPLFFRVHHEMKRFLIYNSSDSLASHLVGTFNMTNAPVHVKAIEAVLGCSSREADAFIRAGMDDVSPYQASIVEISMPAKKKRGRPAGSGRGGKRMDLSPPSRRYKPPKTKSRGRKPKARESPDREDFVANIDVGEKKVRSVRAVTKNRKFIFDDDDDSDTELPTRKKMREDPDFDVNSEIALETLPIVTADAQIVVDDKSTIVMEAESVAEIQTEGPVTIETGITTEAESEASEKEVHEGEDGQKIYIDFKGIRSEAESNPPVDKSPEKSDSPQPQIPEESEECHLEVSSTPLKAEGDDLGAIEPSPGSNPTTTEVIQDDSSHKDRDTANSTMDEPPILQKDTSPNDQPASPSESDQAMLEKVQPSGTDEHLLEEDTTPPNDHRASPSEVDQPILQEDASINDNPPRPESRSLSPEAKDTEHNGGPCETTPLERQTESNSFSDATPVDDEPMDTHLGSDYSVDKLIDDCPPETPSNMTTYEQFESLNELPDLS